MCSFFAIPPKPPKPSPYHVVVDHRERPSGIHHILNDWNINAEIDSLDIGDYLISEKVGCERKTGSDFIGSLFGSKKSKPRLFQQAINLTNAYDRPVWIVEGVIPTTPTTVNSVVGALISLSFDYGIHLFYTGSIVESARVIKYLCRREYNEKRGKIHIPRPKKPKESIHDKQLYLASSFRGWSGVLAQRALIYAGTPRRLFSLSTKELTEIEGIGKGKSNEFANVLDTKFEVKGKRSG